MNLRFILTAAAVVLLTVVCCSSSQSPSTTVERLCRTVELGDVEKAAAFFSNGLISKRGVGPLKTDLRDTSLELKEHGGIKSIKVLKEDVVGDVAEVVVEITRGNGDVATVHYKLIREQGDWKVNAVNSNPNPEGIDPSR